MELQLLFNPRVMLKSIYLCCLFASEKETGKSDLNLVFLKGVAYFSLKTPLLKNLKFVWFIILIYGGKICRMVLQSLAF